ncbi:MAG: leucine-rich repeat protein [Clostridiales bacterium]|nr:leucine-rich repeat protein [Clostridiales bacterium]
MKKKLLIIILSLVCVLTCALGLAACGDTAGVKTDGGMCTVTFDAGRGTIFGERSVKTRVDKNSTVDEPTQEPVCDGYICIGWNFTGDENDALWNFDTDVVKQDIRLYAVWVILREVTFDANGGKFENDANIYKVKVAHNSKLTAVPDVTAPYAVHVLEGWWSDAYGKIDFAEFTITRDITLKARWMLSDEIDAALASFTYRENYGRITVTGVKDKESATSLTVPSVVTYIADYAFKDCINLETVVIDDNISSIGKEAFSGCTKLKSVTLPTELSAIQEYTFKNCASLEEIDIPDTLTFLGVAAFSYCSSLTRIELPAGVTKIPGSAFRGCTALEEVQFGANVTEFGAYAFNDCASLKEFEIPSGVKTVAGNLFEGCSSLQSITVPATCTEIYPEAFQNSGLVTAVIHAKKIYLSAFAGCVSLANLTIGSEVEEIGQGAFSDCTSLTEVEIPDSVTTLNTNVFMNCSSLKSVSIGGGLKEISGGMFRGCSALKNVEFGSNITRINDKAFLDCISLLSFTVPSTVTSVNSKAFDGCARLVEMYNLTDNATLLNNAKPMSNTVIHTSASDASIIKTVNGFSFCTFKDFIYPYKESTFLLDYTGDVENLVLPADYEGNTYKIFKYALSFNPQLKSVKISAGVEAIRDEILLGCDNVTSLTVDSENTYFTAVNNCIISIADEMFVLGCKTSLIPTDGSVTAIGSNVFCHNKTIVNDAFKIPASVIAIKIDAFDGMDGIIRATENGVQYVDNWVVGFEYHKGDYFDLEIEAGTVGIADSAFAANIDASGRWIKSVKTNAELKYIGESAFSFCDFITEVTLNNGLVSIGISAFATCQRLEEIVIPDTVTYMGAAVFNYCSALEYVKLSSSLTMISNQMFSNYNSSLKVVIPTSVVEIGQNIFWKQSGTGLYRPSVYYEGDKAQWNAIKKSNISNDEIYNVAVVYYSETAPSSGIAWHYGADGKPTTQY